MTEDENVPSMWGGALIGRDHVSELQVLLDQGADVNEIEEPEANYTLLHAAAENGAVENVKFLLANGVKTDVVDARGKTAADAARFRDEHAIAAIIDDFARSKSTS